MAKQGLENLQKKQNITKTTTSGAKANLPSIAKPNLPSQPSVSSVSDNTVQTLVDNLQPKKQTSVPVRDQYSVASAFKNVPVDSFTGNTLTTAGAATIDLFKNLVNAPPMIAESASRLGYNLLDAPVTDMRSKVTPQEITKSDSGVRGVAHTLAEGLFGVPEQKEQKQDDSLLNAVKQQFASVGDEPVKQITEWTDPWNKTLQGAVQGVDAVSEAYRNAVQPVTDWMANASEQTRNLAEEQYGQYLSPVAHFISDAIGNIAPNVARRLVVGGLSGDNKGLYRTLSDVAMFSGAFAPAYEEAKAKGLSDNEARLDALFRASIETGTEHMSDTFGLVGGQTDLDKTVLTRIANSNMNPFLKYARAVSWSSFGEATEEGASSGLNKLTDSYMYGTPIDPKVTAVDIVKEAFAGFISSAVEALLGGAGTYNRYAQIFERLAQDKSGEVAEDVAKAYKDELRKEFALVWASMTGNTAEGEYYDPVALELISTAQDKMRSLYGEDDEIANMSPFELLQRVDDIVQREIMDMSPEQYEEYRDRVNGTEAPIVTMGTPDGGTYEVYAYIGEKTDDQVRMLDLADRHGQNVILVDSLYGNQNAATLDDGTILISAKAKKPIQTLVFHEMFHALRSDGKWNDLLELAYDARSKEDGFEEWRDNLMATYLPYYGQVDLDRIRELASYSITRDEEQRKQDVHDELIREANEQYEQGGVFKDKIDEEVAADYMERFGNEETIRNMYNRSGDIFDRVYQGIKDAVSLASGKATGEGRTLLEAERLFSKVARQEMREQQRAEQYLLQNGYNFHGADGTLYSVGYSTADANLANVDREQLINDIVTASKGVITDEKARQFVEDEEVMAMSIKDTALDFEAEPGEEAIKKNTDYPQGTIDLTNNCTKRRAITYMTNRLQEELPDDLFTADDYADIRLIMMDDGRVVACGLCFVEDRRKQLGEIAQTFRDEWANSEDGYLWRTNSSGNRVKVSIGKDLAKRYGVKSGLVTVNDLNMQQVNFGSSDSWHKFQKEHPYEAAAFEAFNNARGQNAGRLLVPRAEYKREILSWSPEKVQSVNDLGGLRIFSFSDFESIHMLDIIQIIEDCAARGVMIQGYTKQPNFAKLVRNTGIKLNRSLIPYGATGLKTVNGRLVLAMNTAEGMDITSKDFIDETDNPNVGNNITGINDKQIHVAMTDDFIHYIIPFHTGKSNEANLRLGVGKWDNYKDYQTDKSLSAEDTKRLALRTSELKAQGMDDTEAYKRAMKELKIKPTAGKMINIYTEVLSDPTVNNVVAFQNKFFEVCYEKGITPRFSQFLDTDANGKFVYTPGYEKMLVDFKLFDRDGNLLKQEVVKPDFERSFMQQIIDDDLKKTEEELQGADYPQELYDKVLNYIRVKHGYEGDYQAYEELKEKIDKNVTNLNSDNESVQGYALSPSVMNSLMELNVQRPGINDRYSQFPAAMYSLSDEELDQQYFDAINRNDMDEAQRLRDEHAREGGVYDPSRKLYHGTNRFGWTEYRGRQGETPLIYTTNDTTVSANYAGNQHYAATRDLGKPFSGGDDIDSIAQDYNNTSWGYQDYRPATDVDRQNVINDALNNLQDVIQKVYDLQSKQDYDFPLKDNGEFDEEIANAIYDLESWVWDADGYANEWKEFDLTPEYRDEYRRYLNNDIEKREKALPIVREYWGEHKNELSDGLREYIEYLASIGNYDVSDHMGYIYRIADALANEDILISGNGATITGSEAREVADRRYPIASYKFYGNHGDNPYYIDAEGAGWTGIKDPNVSDGYVTTDKLARWAYDNGYSSVIMDNIYDGGNKAQNNVFFDPRAIKLADAITYDDKGNIIPLSQRDNPNNPDIRYSLDEDYDAAVAEGNTEEQQRLVNEAAVRAFPNSVLIQNGTFRPMWHFTDAEFTSFLPGTSPDPNGIKGIYFAPTDNGSLSSRMGTGKPYYLNVTNPIVPAASEHKELANRLREMQRGVTDREELARINRQFIEETGVDAVVDWMNGWYTILSPEQIKSAEPITYDDDGNVIPLSERFIPNSNDIRYSLGQQYDNWEDAYADYLANPNSGMLYHAGDLGKAESRATQGYSRGTGHYGTGTYFVSNPYELKYGYGDRPVESVDPSPYNLFRPQNEDDGYTLHEFLKAVDGGIFGERAYTADEIDDYNERATEAANSDDPAVMLPLIEEGRQMLGDYFQDALNIVNRWNGTDFHDSEMWNADTDEITPPVTNEELTQYGEDTLYAIMDAFTEYGSNSSRGWHSNQDIINRAYGMVNDVSRILGVSPEEVVRRAEEIDTANLGEDLTRTDDSRATRFIKSFGYEGTDVSGIDGLDNTRYGSVIYDLKGNDLARKQANGARFSLSEDIPEQANAFPDRNVPRDRSAMRTLGNIYREQGRDIDSLSYEEVVPERMEEPEDLDSYRELMKDVDEDYESPDPEMEEVEFYQSLVPNGKAKGGNKAGSAGGFSTLQQFFDTVAGKNTEARKKLTDIYERPLYETKKDYTINKDKALQSEYEMAKKTGVWGGTKESAAAQWYGEGFKEEDGKRTAYTLESLKKDFPDKWESIAEFAKYARGVYDSYIPRLNNMLESIYGDPNRKHQEDIATWTKQVENLKLGLESAYAIKNPGVAESIEMDIANLQRKIDETQRKIDNGDYRVGKRLTPRKDYFHHFKEIQNGGIKGVKNLLQAVASNESKGNIDTELVGKSEFTKPLTRWFPFLQRRGKGEYTADAVKGLAKYIESAEYAIAFDPIIANYRNEISKLVKATKQTKNANTMIDYLSDYTNQLAGKTSYLDRAARKWLGGEGNRDKLYRVLSAINNKGKANAVVGNLRTVISQIYNIPNAMANIKSNTAWAKGGRDFIQSKFDESDQRKIIDQSPFLAERYAELSAKDFDARQSAWDKISGKIQDGTDWLMEIGDREATELIWFAAYNEALEKGESDPIFYADDMTRRSVAGRGVGEVPYAMKSQLAGFFIPFQTESNNQWQNIKGMVRDKDANGLVRLMVGSYLMNFIGRAMFNDTVLPDVLEVLEEALRRLFHKKEDETVGEILGDAAKRTAGEVVSGMTGASLWLPFLLGDNAEDFFGSSDPTRYGTGTVGLSTVASTVADAMNGDGFDAVTPLLQLGLPYGGKQASRLYNTLQDFNVLPSNGWANTPINGETNPVNGDYSRAGALRYTLPNEVNSWDDAFEIARALAFGSNATNAAQEYYDTGKPALSAEKVAKLREDPNLDADLYMQYLKEANADGSGGISQQEAAEWISSHNLTKDEADALWNATNSNWKKSYEDYSSKDTGNKSGNDSSRNTSNNSVPKNKNELAKLADSNGNGTLTQAEAWEWLSKQDMPEAQKASIWRNCGWKTSYYDYKEKHS